MRNRKIVFAAYLACSVLMLSNLVFTYSQSSRLAFHHLSPEEGLSQGSNDHIYQDSRGFIWLSSLDGLNRFDGQEVKVYKSIAGDSTSLLGNIITSNFHEDEQANLWFTSYEGLHCYLRSEDNFITFQLSDGTDQIQTQDYSAIYLEGKELYLRIGEGEDGHLYQFHTQTHDYHRLGSIDGQRQQAILDKTDSIQSIVSYTFRGGKKGIEIYDWSVEEKLPSLSKSIPASLLEFNVFHIYPHTKTEWYISTDQGLVLFDPVSKQWRQFREFQNESVGLVYSSLLINDTTLLLSSSKFGLMSFATSTKEFLQEYPRNSEQALDLNLQRPNKLYQDKAQNIWIGSFREGVAFAHPKKQKFKYPPLFQGKNINALYESQEGLLFCSYGVDQLAYYPSATASPVPIKIDFKESQERQSIQHFFEIDHELWAISNSSLFKWQVDQQTFVFQRALRIPNLYLWANPKGKILLSNYRGIYEIKKEEGELSIEPFQALGSHQKSLATSIFEDQKGHLYLALDASRLLILAPEEGSYKELQEVKGIGYAKSFLETDSIIWVSTTTGLLKIKPADWSSNLLNQQQDGIPNEHYYSVLADNQGRFWLSCNRGILCYDPENKVSRSFNLADGIQANEYNTDAFLRTSSGEIWLGGTNGLNHFYPAQLKDLAVQAKVQITDLQINDEWVKLSPQISERKSIRLPYSQNTLSFHFVALEYSDPLNTQLEYQLENHENTWVKSGSKGFARYSNLPHGKYVFKVRASNSDGIWSDHVLALKVTINTPWWKSPWFFLACILLGVSLVYAIFQYRLRQALKVERMRVKISSDLHDDVGGLLSGLAMQSELLKMTANPERKPKLERISELSRAAMARMRDTVWAIDARKDKLGNLLDRIREHAAETLELKDIHYEVQVSGLTLDKNMPSQLRQNLYLITKEAITNAAKYSSGDQLKIHFSKHGRKGLILSIKDNGVVDPDKIKRSGLGLNNMEARAQQIGASFELDLKDGFGITVKMP